MSGADGAVGSVGAAPDVAHAGQVALHLLESSRLSALPGGRIRPIFMSGFGATKIARQVCCDPGCIITEAAQSRWKRHRESVRAVGAGETWFASQFDTVGVVVWAYHDDVGAAASSGGLSLKAEGRIGR